MATQTTRGIQLIRTDDSTPGIVKFYDRREADVKQALIGLVDVGSIARQYALDQGVAPEQADRTFIAPPVLRAAVHGITQNILDASNKLEGDDRVAYIAQMCERVQNGGWASAPVDEEKLRANAISALTKLGIPADKAAAMVDAR